MRERDLFNRSSVEQELKIPNIYPLEETPGGGGSVPARGEILFNPINPKPKTKRMLELEHAFSDRGSSLPEIMRSVLQERRTIVDSAKTLGVYPFTFIVWARNFDIPYRRRTDPVDVETKAKMSAANQRKWQDRRDELIAKVHTPESDRKRSESRIRFNATHPEARLKAGRQIAEARRKTREEAYKSKLGEDPMSALRELHLVQRLSLAEISSRTGIREAALRKLGKGQMQFRRKLDNSFLSFRTGNRAVVEQAREAGLLDSLSSRQRQIIEGIYLAEGDPKGLKELSEQFGISSERVRQIEQETLIKLRLPLEVFPEYNLNQNLKPDYWREFDILGLDPKLANKLFSLGYNSIKDLYHLLKAGKARGLTESEQSQLEDKIESFRQQLIVTQSVE